CEDDDLVLVSFVFGPRLPAHGRCVGSREELAKLASRSAERVCYVVEVCPGCSWYNLLRTFALRLTARYTASGSLLPSARECWRLRFRRLPSSPSPLCSGWRRPPSWPAPRPPRGDKRWRCAWRRLWLRSRWRGSSVAGSQNVWRGWRLRSPAVWACCWCWWPD